MEVTFFEIGFSGDYPQTRVATPKQSNSKSAKLEAPWQDPHLAKHETKFFMVNGKLEILQFIQHFRAAKTHRDPKECIFNFNALCVCLLHYFLLGSLSGHADSILLDFTQQISQHKGFAGLLLAETLMGLDKVYTDSSAQFSSSPLILQVSSRSLTLFCPSFSFFTLVKLLFFLRRSGCTES